MEDGSYFSSFSKMGRDSGTGSWVTIRRCRVLHRFHRLGDQGILSRGHDGLLAAAPSRGPSGEPSRRVGATN